MTGLRAEIMVVRGNFRLGVTLDVPAGEVLAVLGPNGSGKSTLLDVLAGLLRPDAGVVRVAGRTLVDTAARVNVPPYQRKVGLLSQDPLLFPHLSVLDNVAFGPRSRGTGRRLAERLAAAWLSEVDVMELADRRPGALSGGQAQRVAVARALATEPDLLLLDEPFAALDVDAAPAVRGLVRRVLRDRERAGTVLVTHDPLDALVLSDRVIVLDGGAIVEQGPTREVLARPRTAFTARIAGLDLVAGEACAGGLRTADGSVVAGLSTGSPLADGEPAVAVFRPAAVSVRVEWIGGGGHPKGGRGWRSSPRNVFPAVVGALEPHGDVIRLRAEARPDGPAWVAGLAADLTPEAVAELALDPDGPIHLVVKATEVSVYPLAREP